MRCLKLLFLATILACCSIEIVHASSAAGTETLVGIVGKDFVLLGADSSVSQSIALTASNLDKIAHLVDPFPNSGNENDTESQQQRHNDNNLQQPQRRQQTILAAAAGDAADSDRLLGYLKAIGSLEEYKNGGLGCDVRQISLGTTTSTRIESAGLDAKSMAHFARRCIWERLRSRTPYRICLLVAGMVGTKQEQAKTAFLSQRVQTQVLQASKQNEAQQQLEEEEEEAIETKANHNNSYKPSLFWLDEYGSLQEIEYGAHGHGSNFLLSILDQRYRPDLTRSQALELMKECFQELRGRYVINSPEDPCIKCVDADGVRLL